MVKRREIRHRSEFVDPRHDFDDQHRVRHTANGDSDIVELNNLAVMVTVEDDGSWFAQGLEIDYFVQGNSFEELKSRFETGLAETIGEYLEQYGSIEHMLRPAPGEVWDEFAKWRGSPLMFSQVSVHHSNLVAGGFRQDIAYYETPKQRAA